MAYARSQSFDNLLTVSSTNNSELQRMLWRPRTDTNASKLSADSLESGYDTVDGRKAGNSPQEADSKIKERVQILNGKADGKQKRKGDRQVLKMWLNRFFGGENRSLKILVITLFFVIIISIPIIWHFYNEKQLEVDLGRNIRFFEKDRIIKMTRDGSDVLEGKLGQNIPTAQLPHDCARNKNKSENICLSWFGEARLNVDYRQFNGVDCYHVQWQNFVKGKALKDCFKLADSHWYGGPIMQQQRWPIEIETFDTQPYVTGSTQNRDLFGSVVERHWLSSNGVLISAEHHTPLFVSMNATNEHELCFEAHYYDSPYQNENDSAAILNYTLCNAPNLLAISQFVNKHIISRASSYPDMGLIMSPVWSGYLENLNETQLLNLAAEIKNQDFEGDHIELDIYKAWEERVGDFEFNAQMYPSEKNFTLELRKLGFNLTVGVHPFTNINCGKFLEGADLNYFVHDTSGTVPGLTKWWHGLGTILDTTNHEAVKWFKRRLRVFSYKYNIERLTFYWGQFSWLPFKPTFYHNYENPDKYGHLYAQIAAEFGNSTQVDIGSQSQDLPIFLRLEDRSSSWEGLQSVIPTVLTCSLQGYSFIHPGLIGGRNMTPTNDLPDKELYIRWLQLATFLPIMQFSTPPWHYDDAVVKLAKFLVALHKNFTAVKVSELAKEHVDTGNPIYRPLWWISPINNLTLTTDSQFLIGDEILVAAVVSRGVRKRDIYLPNGSWKDMNSGKVYDGEQLLRDYPADINSAPPYFQNMA